MKTKMVSVFWPGNFIYFITLFCHASSKNVCLNIIICVLCYHKNLNFYYVSKNHILILLTLGYTLLYL